MQLNQTPIAENVSQLLTEEGISPPRDHLVLGVLLDWVTENLAGDPAWAKAVDQVAAGAEERNPAGMSETLSEAPGLESATTLREAGRIMMAWVADLIPPGSQAV